MKRKYIYALTYKERIGALRKKYTVLETDSIFLDRWHNIRGLCNLNNLELLLNLEDLSLNEFIYAIKPFSKIDEKILAESLDNHKWHVEIDRILKDYKMSDNDIDQELSFSYVIRPFLNDLNSFLNNIKEILAQRCLFMNEIVIKKIIRYTSTILENIVFKVVISDWRASKNNSGNKAIDMKYLKEKYGTKELLDSFYSEYPVMTRHISERLMMLKDYIKKGFFSLIQTEEEINEKLNIKIKDNKITDIEFEEDISNVGKGTVIYTFENNQKITYVPNNFKLEQCFCELISWINYSTIEQSDMLDLPISNAIYQKNFTLRPYLVNYLPVESELRNYYQRLGQLSVILYLISGDNIYSTVEAYQNMTYINNDTLFQMDVEVLELEKNVKNSIPKNYPEIFLINKDIEPNFIHDFKKGSSLMSCFIREHKEEFYLKLKEYFTLKVRVRQYMKATDHYNYLIQFLYHPNYLKDMFYLEKLLDNTLAYPYKDKRICVFEIDAMKQGNIPVFYTELGNKDVITSRGQRITNYFDQTPFEQTMKRVKTFDSSEMVKRIDDFIDNLQKFKTRGEVLG